MNKITYDDLKFPTYVNSNVAVRFPARVAGKRKNIELSVSDLAKAIVLGSIGSLWVSDTGKGKSTLMDDIAWHYFNGDARNQDGKASIQMGRKNFEIEDLLVRTQVDLGTGKYDSNTIRQIDSNMASRLFFGIHEINRAPSPIQNDFMDFANGEYNFKGANVKLGSDGYVLFMANGNLNKFNGEFKGTSDMDRALLNRANVTIDLDHPDFRPTPEDEMVIDELKSRKKEGSRTANPPPNNLSEKILLAHNEIVSGLNQRDPYFDAIRFVIGRGLDYCDADAVYHDKTCIFPMKCTEDCTFAGKDLCSRIKGSSERTLIGMKKLANALVYVAELKEGKKIDADSIDVALQAFRLTPYHGNLNEHLSREEFSERRQAMMDSLIQSGLEPVAELLKLYIPVILRGNEPRLMKYTNNGKEITAPNTQALQDALKKKSVSFVETDLEAELKAKGIGCDWVSAYTKKWKGEAKND